MEKDIFCKIIDGEIPSYKIYEDEKFLAFLDVNPINLGHTLIIPKKHSEYVFELDEADYLEIFEVARKLEEPLQKATEAVRIGIAVEGFGVPHTHVHLVPLYKMGQLNPELQSKASEEDLGQMQQKILENL